jgi:hypothetical protein
MGDQFVGHDGLVWNCRLGCFFRSEFGPSRSLSRCDSPPGSHRQSATLCALPASAAQVSQSREHGVNLLDLLSCALPFLSQRYHRR